MRGRGYVGQFSRNSMGRDRHSNPPVPPVHPLWKLQPVQTSLKLHTRLVSILSHSRSFPLCLSLRILLPPISRSRVFPRSLFLSSSAIRLSTALAYRIRLSLPVPLFQGAPNSNPQTVLRDFNSCDNYPDFSCTRGSDGSIVSL